MRESFSKLWADSVRWDGIKRHVYGRGLNIGSGEFPISIPMDALDARPGVLRKHELNCFCDAIPVPGSYYDFALASHVMEHLANPIKGILEWSRILKPGAVLLVFMPDCRLYVPDRKKFDIVEARGYWMADRAVLLEKYRSRTPNFPARRGSRVKRGSRCSPAITTGITSFGP